MSNRGTMFCIVLLAAVSGAVYSVFLENSESNETQGTNSDLSQSQRATATSEVSQKEIEDLLDLKGDHFIEVTRFAGEPNPNSYWQYEARIQEIMTGLENYNRLVVETRFRKSGLDESNLSHEKYYRVLIGPFSKEEALEQTKRLVSTGYRDASVTQLTKSDDVHPLERHWLLLLHTKDEGPKFISGWLIGWWSDVIEYVVSTKSNKLLLQSVDTYEGYRNGAGSGKLFLVDGKTGTIEAVGDFRSQGFVILPDTQSTIVQKTFVLSPKEALDERDYSSWPFYPVHRLSEDDLTKVAKEIGVPKSKLQAQYAGEGSGAAIPALFELDLETKQLRSLKMCGGLGGIFAMEDGKIYLSNSTTVASYADTGINRTDRLGMFGKKPYYRLEAKKQTLTKMPNDFVPDQNQIAQPRVAQVTGHFAAIAEVGVVRLTSFKGQFYIQH